EVSIDVRPESSQNRVNPFAQGVVQVALLSAEGFDATQVDTTSLGFGPSAAPAVHVELVDVNGDGLVDLVSHHSIPLTGIALGDTQACLVGTTLDGVAFSGCDEVSTVPEKLFGPEAHGKQQGEPKGNAH